MKHLLNTYSGKKVLVTGNTGFKGGWMSVWLNHLNANVKGYSLDPNTKVNFFEVVGVNNIIDSEINDIRDHSALKKANNINSELIKNNIEAIIDDTDENYSSKIKKMNLIGAPYQIVIGKKTEGDLLEFKEIGGKSQNLSLDKIIEIITKQKTSN